jgi:midasin
VLLSLQVGRAVLPVQQAAPTNSASEGLGCFTPTGLALRLMERIGVCLSRAEPVLLVGETGTGKTTTLTQVRTEGGRGVARAGGCCQWTLLML